MSSPDFTEEVIQKYLANPSLCPLCGSNDITASKQEPDIRQFHQRIDCVKCRRSWWEVYELKTIEMDPEL